MTSSSLSSLSSSSFFSTTIGLKSNPDKNPKKSTLVLPNSLVVEIFLYLEEREMLISTRVCKQWREVNACHTVQKELITRYAFGRRQWNTYFGDIGEEPPLPSNIGEILGSPCPVWPDKRVRETHLLTLVPATVNGEVLTLQSLGELVKKPKEGHKTQYYPFYPGGNEKASMEKNTWVLLTRDVLPESYNQPYESQVALVEQLVTKAKVSYVVPRLIEIAASLFMHYVRSRERLYSHSPFTCTCCQEEHNDQRPVVIGGFSTSGVFVSNFPTCGNEGMGVGVVRKF